MEQASSDRFVAYAASSRSGGFAAGVGRVRRREWWRPRRGDMFSPPSATPLVELPSSSRPSARGPATPRACRCRRRPPPPCRARAAAPPPSRSRPRPVARRAASSRPIHGAEEAVAARHQPLTRQLSRWAWALTRPGSSTRACSTSRAVWRRSARRPRPRITPRSSTTTAPSAIGGREIGSTQGAVWMIMRGSGSACCGAAAESRRRARAARCRRRPS